MQIERRWMMAALAAAPAALAGSPITAGKLMNNQTPPQDALRLPPCKTFEVKTSDGLAISAQEWGPANGPEVVFIHGLAQSHLCWQRQIASPVFKGCRIVTYDLRGHGGSDKPQTAAHYSDGARWGDELAAVIAAAGMRRPLLVGWSLGGVIISHYLMRHGGGGIAGINLVDAGTKLSPEMMGEKSLQYMSQLTDADLRTRINALRGFLHACFVVQPTQAEYEIMLAYNSMTPLAVFQALGLLSLDGAEAALKSLKVPVLVTHGAQDALFSLAVSRYSASVIPGAMLSIYDGVGHSPFFEAPDRFNAELFKLLGSR